MRNFGQMTIDKTHPTLWFSEIYVIILAKVGAHELRSGPRSILRESYKTLSTRKILLFVAYFQNDS